MKISHRLRAAFGILTKGSIAPFDRLIGGGASGGEALRDPFRRSAWVMRAVKLVAMPISEVPLRLSTDGRNGRQLLTDPELNAYWQTPAVGCDRQPMSFCDFAELSVIWLKLTGNCFWLLDDTVFAGGAMPFPEAGRSFPRLLLARPDRMTAQHSRADGSLVGWKYRDGAGRESTLAVEQVVHLKLPSPSRETLGESEYDAVEIAAETDYLAGVFKRNLWRANGDRGPFIVARQWMDDAQREQLLAQLRDKRELGARGIFKTAVLGGDITVEDPKAQMVDAAFVAARPQDRHEIFIGFGVPASMADVAASYSIGSASDWYRLIRDTCIPTARKLSEGIERVLKMQRGAAIYAWFDWKAHPVMQETLRELIDPATKLWDRGMSWEKINDWLGLDLPEFDGWDTGYLPFSVAPASGSALPETDAALAEGADAPAAPGDDEKPGESVAAMLRALRTKAARDPRELALWRVHMARRRAVAGKYRDAFTRHLMMARKETLSKIERSGPLLLAPERRAVAADFLFDLTGFKTPMLAQMRSIGAASLQTAGQELFAEIKRDDPFKMPDPKAVAFLKARQNKLSGVADDVHDRIKAALEEGLHAGDGITALADRVREKFNEISRGRAEVIAMTETSAAYGSARQEAMDQAGIKFKKWLTSGLPNVRAAHLQANGQVVPVGTAFFVGGERLMHPGDEDGEPENVINCHCVSVATEDNT